MVHSICTTDIDTVVIIMNYYNYWRYYTLPLIYVTHIYDNTSVQQIYDI